MPLFVKQDFSAGVDPHRHKCGCGGFFAAAGITLWWLWKRWGRWHSWLIGVPILLALGVTTADAAMNALPNLL